MSPARGPFADCQDQPGTEPPPAVIWVNVDFFQMHLVRSEQLRVRESNGNFAREYNPKPAPGLVVSLRTDAGT